MLTTMQASTCGRAHLAVHPRLALGHRNVRRGLACRAKADKPGEATCVVGVKRLPDPSLESRPGAINAPWGGAAVKVGRFKGRVALVGAPQQCAQEWQRLAEATPCALQKEGQRALPEPRPQWEAAPQGPPRPTCRRRTRTY